MSDRMVDIEGIAAGFWERTRKSQVDRRHGLSALNVERHGRSERMMTASQAEEFIGMSARHLRRLREEGEIDGVETSGKVRFRVSEVARLSRKLCEEGRVERGRRGAATPAVVSFASLKGGVGKTFHSVGFAQCAALRGYRTLAIDMDAQATMSMLLGADPEMTLGLMDTVAPLFVKSPVIQQRMGVERLTAMADLPRATHFPNLDLIPACSELHAVQTIVQAHLTEDGRGAAALLGQQRRYCFFSILAEALPDLAASYDVIVIDTHPDLGVLTQNAVNASNGIIVPVEPTTESFHSAAVFLQGLTEWEVDERLARQYAVSVPLLKPDFLNILISNSDVTSSNNREMGHEIRRAGGAMVLRNEMVHSVAVEAASLMRRGIYELQDGDFLDHRRQVNRETLERARTALNAVNFEIEELVEAVFARRRTTSAAAQ